MEQNQRIPYNKIKMPKEKEETKKIKDPEKQDVNVKIGDHELNAEYREFKSGKKGYGVYGVFKINGWPCRISLNIIEM